VRECCIDAVEISGPGLPHEHLQPLELLAATGRRIVFYDELGCGNSDRPQDPSLWSMDMFVEEVDAVREALGLGRVHLLGASWGATIALQYALTRPAGLESLILTSVAASAPRYLRGIHRLRDDLPMAMQAALWTFDKTGQMDEPTYIQALQLFNQRHVCRLVPWPDYVMEAYKKAGSDAGRR